MFASAPLSSPKRNATASSISPLTGLPKHHPHHRTACDRCRRRKQGCDFGGGDTCKACMKMGHPCLIDGHPVLVEGAGAFVGVSCTPSKSPESRFLQHGMYSSQTTPSPSRSDVSTRTPSLTWGSRSPALTPDEEFDLPVHSYTSYFSGSTAQYCPSPIGNRYIGADGSIIFNESNVRGA